MSLSETRELGTSGKSDPSGHRPRCLKVLILKVKVIFTSRRRSLADPACKEVEGRFSLKQQVNRCLLVTQRLSSALLKA